MPHPPAPAATVILLRDAPARGSAACDAGPEVLMLERHAQSSFLPDMYVFPGGRVEEQDRALTERLWDLDADRARRALPMVDPDWALGYFVAALRETFEESGVILATERGGEPLALEHVAALQTERQAVQSGQRAFADLVAEHDLRLCATALAVHAHWITPESVKRRFDTVFFSAVAPEGQEAAHDGVEVTAHVWLRPVDALEQARAGTRQVIFPTACNLETLCGFEDARAAWRASAARPVVTVLPRVEEHDGQRLLVIPEEAGYGTRRQLVRGGAL